MQIIINLIEEDVSRKLTIGDCAQYVRLSQSRVHGLFKVETGVSLLQYIKNRRMTKAKELLGTTFLTIKEIMNLVGITDASHFVRDFKRAYGMTPSEYRDNHRCIAQVHNTDIEIISLANK